MFALPGRSGYFWILQVPARQNFSPCPGRQEYLKPQASLFYILSDLAGPGVRGVRAARTRAVPLCRFATFPPPRGGIVPSPTAGFLSGNSRCSESASAFFAGRIPPISALYQVRTSRPSLRRLVRANYARSSAALWNFVPMLGLWGSSGSEMPSHFRKCARLRRAQRGYALQGRALR